MRTVDITVPLAMDVLEGRIVQQTVDHDDVGQVPLDRAVTRRLDE
jgi:hypothetical protein